MAAVVEEDSLDDLPDDEEEILTGTLDIPNSESAESPDDEQKEASVAASLSVDSVSSSLLAQFKLDDELLLDSKDLIVRVDNPEKHSNTIESYMTFRVITKTTRSDYDSHEYCVRRRYNDFIWLRQKLEELYPTHIVPPLPEKHSMQRLTRFNVEFIKTRMTALNRFLSRLADHAVLSFDKSLQLFLVAKPFEFAAHRKEGLGIFGRVSNTFHNLAAVYMLKSRTPEFEHVNEYIQTFGDKLSSVERIAQRIQKEQTECISELKELHPVFTLWSSSEQRLGKALVATASAVGKCAAAQQSSVDKFPEEFGQPLREYVLYADAIKDALRRRDATQIEYELTVSELNSRKAEREQLNSANPQYTLGKLMGKDPEEVKKDKQLKVDQIIESLIKEAELANDKVECANANLRSDLERWHVTKREDLKRMFVAMANRQIEVCQQSIQAWEEAIPLIRETDADLDLSFN